MKLFLFSLALLPSQILMSQALNTEWEFIIGEQSDLNTEAWGVDVDTEGNIYFPINQSAAGTGIDIKCYKLDQDKNELWDLPFHLSQIGDDFSHLCDASSESLYIGGGSCILSGVNCDMAVQKIDKNTKELIWNSSEDFGFNGYDEIDGLEIGSDGIYATGWAQALETGLWRIDVGLWKMNFDGETEWTKFHGDTTTGEHQDGHIVLEDDRIVATGLWNGTSVSNIFNGKSFLSAFSRENGDIIDSIHFNFKTLSTPWVENPLSMTSDGEHYYITGYTTPDVVGDLQIFVSKFDKQFNEIWSVNWGGDAGESARAILVHNEKIFVGGYTGSEEYVMNGDGDALLLVLDLEGSILSHHVYGGELLDAFRDMAIYEQSLYLSGFSGIGFSTQESYFANLVKVDIDRLTSNKEAKGNTIKVSVFPNPSSSQISVKIPSKLAENSTFHIYSSEGHILLQRNLQTAISEISTDLLPGVYTYTIKCKNQSYSSRLVVAR